MYKRIKQLFIAVIISGLLFIGCTLKQQYRESVVYRHPMLEAPTGFVRGKPAELTNMSAEVLINQIYEPLFIFDDELKFKPVLIDKWHMSKEDGAYIFYIKRNVYFHDGKELTADDVIYSLYYVAKNYSQNNLISNKKILKKCGRYCVELTVGEAYPPLSNIFAGSLYKIFPKDSIKEGNIPSGTGPFMISSWIEDKIILKRYQEYRNKTQSNINICEFEVMSKEQALCAYNKGDVDDLFEYLLSSNEIAQLDGVKVTLPTYIINYIGLNMRIQPFNNEVVRRAIQHAINRKQLFKKYYSEHLPINGIVPKGLLGGAEADDYFEYNLKKSSDLMKSGNKGQIEADFWIRRQDWNAPFVADVQEQLNHLGINLKIKYETDAKFYNEYFGHKQQMFFITLGSDYKDADRMLSAFSSDNDDNDVGISDETIDSYLKELSLEADKKRRYILIRKIEDQIMKHGAIVPIYQRVASTVYKKNIKNVQLSPSWHEDIRMDDYMKIVDR